MENDKFYKQSLKISFKRKFGENKHQDEINIIYRVVSLNSTLYFAEEIITGCLFPIVNDNIFSCNRTYNYYIEHLSEQSAEIEDVQSYIYENKDNFNWYTLMTKCESKNRYSFNTNIEPIKNFIVNQRKISKTINSEIYVPKINLRDISDLGYDLSCKKELCNLIGREEELKTIIKRVFIGGNSAILVGESGSGKTSIVEKLALDIKNGNNCWLKDKMIFCLDLTLLIAGTQYRGQMENRVKKVIDCCKSYPKRIILFIDEIHNLYGLGSGVSDAMDTMNMLKPYISDGTLTIIGTTTIDEYEKYMTKDSAFLRRFTKINISIPDEITNIKILLSYINDLEKKYNIVLELNDYQKEVVVQYIIKLTNPKKQKILGDVEENNPSISKKIIEEAFLEAIYKNSKIVNIEDICYAILSCDKLSPSLRKEKAKRIKDILCLNDLSNENDKIKVLK